MYIYVQQRRERAHDCNCKSPGPGTFRVKRRDPKGQGRGNLLFYAPLRARAEETSSHPSLYAGKFQVLEQWRGWEKHGFGLNPLYAGKILVLELWRGWERSCKTKTCKTRPFAAPRPNFMQVNFWSWGCGAVGSS